MDNRSTLEQKEKIAENINDARIVRAAADAAVFCNSVLRLNGSGTFFANKKNTAEINPAKLAEISTTSSPTPKS